MKNKKSSFKAYLSVLGFILMILGHITSNADKDSFYRRIVAPQYDKFIEDIRSLQQGAEIDSTDPQFKIFITLLQSHDEALKNVEIQKISNLTFNPSLMSDGAHSWANFEISTSAGKETVRIMDLQEVIDSGLLKNSTYRIAKRFFWIGILLELIAASTYWLQKNKCKVLMKKFRKLLKL